MTEPPYGDPARALCMCGDDEAGRLLDLASWCGDQWSASLALWAWSRDDVAAWLRRAA